MGNPTISVGFFIIPLTTSVGRPILQTDSVGFLEGSDEMETKYKQFDQIDINHPKVHKIINSAYEVFSKNDLEKASTNQIVKLAGISRGLLYHYFKDKEELFDFLVYFAMKVGVLEINEKMDWEEKDFINRVILVTKIRFKIMGRYPYMTYFFQKYETKLNKKELRLQYEKMNPGVRQKFFSYNLDFSQLKEGVDKDKMIQVVRWTMKGMLTDWNERIQSGENVLEADQYIQECVDYLEFQRSVFFEGKGSNED